MKLLPLQELDVNFLNLNPVGLSTPFSSRGKIFIVCETLKKKMIEEFFIQQNLFICEFKKKTCN